jgi:hypothetical protein
MKLWPIPFESTELTEIAILGVLCELREKYGQKRFMSSDVVSP